MIDNTPTSRQIGVQLLLVAVASIMAGLIAVGGVAMLMGGIETRLDRAIKDIEVITRTIYTQRDATLEMRSIYDQIARQDRRIDEIVKRINALESGGAPRL